MPESQAARLLQLSHENAGFKRFQSFECGDTGDLNSARNHSVNGRPNSAESAVFFINRFSLIDFVFRFNCIHDSLPILSELRFATKILPNVWMVDCESSRSANV
jgi:hypothetical protein